MIFEKQIVDAYKGMIFTRCDDTETVFYDSAKDFHGLCADEFSFKSSKGHDLKGYIYNYADFDMGRLIIFDHGFGGGHRAYMKEIELLCRHGYRVLSYDHTGCMESGGDTPSGLSQSLCDLNDCITAVKSDSRFAGLDISVMGHSWGAFSTLNIAALHPDISHIVAISGFVSVWEMVKCFFSGILSGYRKAVFALEKQTNPRFSQFNAIDTLSNAEAKALLIYSENDQMCKRVHYDMLKSALEGRENVSFLLEAGKDHNPNYTKKAASLLAEFGKARAKLLKKKDATAEEKKAFVASFDWEAITEQDEAVWARIFEHLDS